MKNLPPDAAPVSTAFRQRAEAAYREDANHSPENRTELSSEEIQEILYELRVHQIQLEMQNEELRQAQVRLKVSQDRYFDLYDQAPVGYCTVDQHGLILETNLAVGTLLGAPCGNLVGQPLSRMIHKDDVDKLYMLSRQLIKSGEPQSCELRLDKQGGTAVWAQLSATVTQNEEGGPFIHVVITDINDLKRAEAALENRLATLTCPPGQAEDVTFRELFDLATIQRIQDEFAEATGVASIITSLDGTPLTQPSNFCRLCNIIRCTKVGRRNCYRSDAILGHHHPEGPLIQPCLSGGLWDAGASISVGDRHLANWLIGQVRDETQSEGKIREYARAIGVDEGEAAAAFGEVPCMSLARFQQVAKMLFTLANHIANAAYQNVQQARLITERKCAVEAMQKKNEEVEHFTYTVSHDLKSPLVTIKTFLGYLEKDLGSEMSKRLSEDVGFIHGAADKMVLLLEELLKFARIGYKKHPPVEATLQEIVQEAMTLVAGQISERGARVAVTQEPLWLFVDRVRLVEVFQNLLDNAVKFLGEQPHPRIEVGWETVGEELEIFVRDNGLGIDPRHISKLFGLFEKLDPRTPGSGMGLAMVRRIVEAHGGKIRVESAGLGLGTTFRFTLSETQLRPASVP